MDAALLIESTLLFLPMLAANQGPGFALDLHAPGSATPVSIRWLGKNKTVAAYYAGPFLGAFTTYWSWEGHPILIGAILGFAAVLGDHVKSFIKRRRGMPEGSQWFWDRVDYAVGGIIAAFIFIRPFNWENAIIIFAMAWLTHVMGNPISFWLGLRKTPH